MTKLYHASKKQGIKILKPFPHPIVDQESVVFATIDPLFALAMAYGSGDVLAAGYTINNKTGKKDFYLDELSPGSLNLLENPASLYIVESNKFISDKRLCPEELIAREDIKVIKEIKIRNILKELIKMGAHIITYNEVPTSMNERNKDPKKPKVKDKKFGKIKY